MRCPGCGGTATYVLRTRTDKTGRINTRRRECRTCHRRITTHERLTSRSATEVAATRSSA
jgi:transcriptional regulator NrdR family protein